MAKEIVSLGEDFVITSLNRGYGGAESTILKIDGSNNGAMTLNSVNHLNGGGRAPTVAVSAAAQLGTGPTSSINALASDLSGVVTVRTGTSPGAFVGGTAASLCTVTFAVPFATPPNAIQVMAVNSATAASETGTTGISYFVDNATITANSFVIKAVSAGTPTLTASTNYLLSYVILG